MTAPSQRAIVLLALGTPSNADVSEVRRFLRDFLGDKRVISLPWLLRKSLLEFLILPFRSRRSAEMYQKIWTPRGSPFRINLEALRERVQALFPSDVPVFVAMRYGEPSAEKIIRELNERGIREIAVLPQFPQYAESSYETAVEHFKHALKKIAPAVRAKILPPFYDSPGYLNAIAETLQGIERSRDFVFSFHGIPVKSILRVAKTKTVNCDLSAENFEANQCASCPASEKCYRRQCYTTARKIAELANLPTERVYVAFQSRFGKGTWLVPETSKCIFGKNTVLVAPGFTVDNLETLLELRELAPGQLVPCLNDSPAFAEFLAESAKSLFRSN